MGRTRRVHILVSGRVQGVFFRAETRREAQMLGLSGYVRNRHDGNVEIEAEGDSTHVMHLVAWVGHGPSMAHVDDMELTEKKPTGKDEGFDVRY